MSLAPHNPPDPAPVARGPRRFLGFGNSLGEFSGNALLSVGTNLAMSGVAVVTSIWTARLLGPQGRGELAAIQSFPGLLVGFALLGIPNALVYYSAAAPRRSASYLSTCMTLSLLGAIPTAIVGYLAMPLVLAHQRAAVIVAARFYLLTIGLHLCVGAPSDLLRGSGRFLAWNLLRLQPILFWLAVCVLAWLVRRPTAEFLSTSYVTGQWLLVIPVAAMVWRHAQGSFRPILGQSREMLRYGLPSMLGNLPKLLNVRLDQVLMSALVAPTVLGMYAVAVAWSNLAAPILQGLGFAFLPRLAGAGESTNRRGLFAQGSRATLLVAVSLGLAHAVLTPLGLPLFFGRQFRPAVQAALVLIAASVCLNFNGVLEEGMMGLGYPSVVWRAELSGLVVTGAGLWLLLQRLPLMGAAIASLAGYATVMAVLVFQAAVLTGCSLEALLWPRPGELCGRLRQMRAQLVS